MTFYLLDGSGNFLTDDSGNRLVTMFAAGTTTPGFTVGHDNGKRHVKMIGY